MSPDHDLDPARLLKEARAASGLSQRALAALAGTSQSVVARIESEETSPLVKTLDRLIRAVGLRVEATLRPRSPSGGHSARGHTANLLGEGIARHLEGRADSGIVSAYLFGSAARGRMHRESDVDVGVLLDHGAYPSSRERADLRVRLAAELVEAIGIDEVDLSILNDVPPTLARAVVLDGARVHLGDPEKDHAFVRDVQLRAADLEPFLKRMRRVKLERLRA